MQTGSLLLLKYGPAKQLLTAAFACLWLLAAAGPAHAADVSVQINLPAPVVVLPAPPHMVWLPGPQVYIAFGSPHPIFYRNDNYYLFDHDVWYVGPGYGGPWARIKVQHLPPGLHQYRREQWEDYQRQAQPRYRADSDRDHRNFVGWKDKKEKNEKSGKRKYDQRDDDKGGNNGRGHGRGRKDD